MSGQLLIALDERVELVGIGGHDGQQGLVVGQPAAEPILPAALVARRQQHHCDDGGQHGAAGGGPRRLSLTGPRRWRAASGRVSPAVVPAGGGASAR